MPNFDGGHYFFTGLYPVSLEPVHRQDRSITSPSHLLRESLASLPNFSEAAGPVRASPFARSLTTHFVRLAVIDDPAFNGRVAGDAIRQAIKGVDLLAHQPVDHLSRAWLLLAADFDAPDDSEAVRDSWANDLWTRMEPELRAIFQHCHGFDRVDGPQAFAAYLARGQIDTTMSFNDYWIDPMGVRSLSLGRLGLVILLGLALFLGLAWWIDREWGGGWLLWVGLGLFGVAAGIRAAYRMIMRRGARPFPTAPDSDLRSVLKGLYLQQRLTRFAIEHQGAEPQALYDAFGKFLAEVRPGDLDGPTQPPGVLRVQTDDRRRS
jgi:hypothetical protein